MAGLRVLGSNSNSPLLQTVWPCASQYFSCLVFLFMKREKSSCLLRSRGLSVCPTVSSQSLGAVTKFPVEKRGPDGGTISQLPKPETHPSSLPSLFCGPAFPAFCLEHSSCLSLPFYLITPWVGPSSLGYPVKGLRPASSRVSSGSFPTWPPDCSASKVHLTWSLR